MTPTWLYALAVLSLVLALLSTVAILFDLRRRPQPMGIINAVWPVTALYFGPFGLWAYWRLGRAAQPQEHQHGHHHGADQERPFWVSVFAGTTHCGAGCTLGDIIAEFLVFFAGIAISGSVFGGQLVFDYAFAFTLGILFQYYSIVPMRGLRPVQGIIAAVKADFLSLTSFEIGLFGWMALMRFVFFGPDLHPNSPVYWFMMQIGMAIGFATSYPMNWLLLKKGLKECM